MECRPRVSPNKETNKQTANSRLLLLCSIYDANRVLNVMFLLRSRMQNTQTGSCLTLVGGAGRNLPTPGALSGTRCGEAPVPTTCGDVPGAVLPFSVRFPTQEGLSSGLASLLCVRLMSKWTSNQAVTTSTFCSPFTHP